MDGSRFGSAQIEQSSFRPMLKQTEQMTVRSFTSTIARASRSASSSGIRSR
jgi:hypothetical protein